MRWRKIWETYRQERAATSTKTSPLMASTNLVFNLRRGIRVQAQRPVPPTVVCWGPCGSASHLAFHRRARRDRLPLVSVLLQFIVQRLQTDAKDLGGPGLVIVRRFQGLHDQLALGLVHGGPHADVDALAVAHHAARGLLAEARRQMARLDDAVLADDDGALQAVAQLAHIAGPGEILKQPQDGVADAAHAALVLVVHVLNQR